MTGDRTKLQVGIVGASRDRGWARQSHLPAFRSGISGIELGAVCGRSAESAEACAREFGARRWYGDYEEMLASPELDVIAIAVALPDHVSLAQRAIEAGKHVFIEWPMVFTSDEAQGLVDLAARRGVRTAVGLQSRHSLELVHVRRLIEEGSIGEVMAVNARQATKRRRRLPSDIEFRHHDGGVNMLTVAGGHVLDGLMCMVGQIASLSATIDTRITEWFIVETGAHYDDVTAPDQIAACGRMQNGASLAMRVGASEHNLGHRVEILGSEGTIVIEAHGPAHLSDCTVWFGRADADLLPLDVQLTDDVRQQLRGQPENVARLWRNFAAAIRSGERFDPDFSSGLVLHRLIETLRRASDSGTAQAVH